MLNEEMPRWMSRFNSKFAMLNNPCLFKSGGKCVMTRVNTRVKSIEKWYLSMQLIQNENWSIPQEMISDHMTRGVVDCSNQ